MKTQGIVLGAFFYGYAMTNIAGGMIAQKIGGKLTMWFGVFWTAFLTLLTPVFTTVGGFWAIFFVRLLEGIGEVSNDVSKEQTDECICVYLNKKEVSCHIAHQPLSHKNFGTLWLHLGGGVRQTPERFPSVHLAEYGRSKSNDMSVIS